MGKKKKVFGRRRCSPSIFCTTPSRRQVQAGGMSSARAAMDCSLRYSCTKATVLTMATARAMLTASSYCFTSTLTRADARSSPISGSLNWSRNLRHSGSSSSWSSSLYPCSWRWVSTCDHKVGVARGFSVGDRSPPPGEGPTLQSKWDAKTHIGRGQAKSLVNSKVR